MKPLADGWKRALFEGGAVLIGVVTAFAIDAARDARGERTRGEAHREALKAGDAPAAAREASP